MAAPPGVSHLLQPLTSGAAAPDAPEGSQPGHWGPDPVGACGGDSCGPCSGAMLGPGFGAEAEERRWFPRHLPPLSGDGALLWPQPPC